MEANEPKKEQNTGEMDVMKQFMELLGQQVDLCQYFRQKKLKGYAAFLSSSSSFCWGVL